MLVGSHVPTNFQMYRQIPNVPTKIRKALLGGGGSCPPCPPPLATLMPSGNRTHDPQIMNGEHEPIHCSVPTFAFITSNQCVMSKRILVLVFFLDCYQRYFKIYIYYSNAVQLQHPQISSTPFTRFTIIQTITKYFLRINT